jgi:putative sporulation protein YtxC
LLLYFFCITGKLLPYTNISCNEYTKEGVKFMTSEIIVGTLSYHDQLRVRLDAEMHYLTGEKCSFEFIETVEPPWSFFVLRPDCTNRRGYRSFAGRFAVAKAVSDLLVNHVEVNYIKQYIEKTYYYWSDEDRQGVLGCTLETMEKLKTVRRNKILQNIYDYLATEPALIVEGFVRFRLKDHWNYLQRLVRRSGQEFMEARDYLEFIRLLRCFLDMQEPKIDEVQVFITAEGTFYLCDKKGHVIKREQLRTPSFTVIDGEFNYKEYLLSILITMAPREIVFHVSDHIWDCDPLQTIQQVFGSRIKRCPGCEKCQQLDVHKI